MKVLCLSLLSLLFLNCESPIPAEKTPPTQVLKSQRLKSKIAKPPAEDEDLIYLEEMPKIRESPQPILVVMHGYGSNERNTLGWAKALNDRFFVVSVRAPIALGKDRYAWFGRGKSDDKVVAAHADKVIVAIEGLPRTANSQGSGTDDRIKGSVFVAGFSQGGRMAIEVAKRAKPGLIQGVIAFSPAIFTAEKLTLPTLIFHGHNDNIVPFNAIQPIVKKLIKTGSPVTFESFDGRHTIPRGALESAGKWANLFLPE